MMPSLNARLLVSVRNVDEAQAVLESGADLIDIKEPSRGPLGRADIETIRAILVAVAGHLPVSAAWGEWGVFDQQPMPPSGLRFIKIGLAQAPDDWHRRLTRAVENDTLWSTTSPSIVITAYADHHRVHAPSIQAVVDGICHLAKFKVDTMYKTHNAHMPLQTPAVVPRGLLIDTAIKDGRRLFDWCDESDLKRWIGSAHEGGLEVALAGSLQHADIERAASLGADIVAVRGAACREGDRDRPVDPSRVRQCIAALRPHISCS